MSEHLVGFDGIRFTVLPDPSGATYPDWGQPFHEPEFPIPGTNTVVLQDMGAGLATWTVRLEFPSMERYRELRSRQKTVGVLTLYAEYTSAAGTIYNHDGIRYEDLDGVELVRLERASIEIGQQWVEAEALFRRPMDPLTGRRA